MEPQCLRSHLKEPWRRPIGKLQIIGSTDELPPALDGVVELDAYRDMIGSVAEKAAKYRGGLIHIAVAIFQAFLFVVIMLGFFVSKLFMQRPFFNPITLGVLGTLEFGVLLQSARSFQMEEHTLTKDLLEIFHPWRDYGVFAKVRKTRGQCRDGEGKKSSIFYCLVLEKRGPEDGDIDTASLSSFTEIESDIESQA